MTYVAEDMYRIYLNTGVQATGTLTVANNTLTSADTFTIGTGNTLAAVTNFAVGATATITAANIAAAITANTAMGALVTAVNIGTTVIITQKLVGTGIVFTAGANITASGAGTLAGGIAGGYWANQDVTHVKVIVETMRDQSIGSINLFAGQGFDNPIPTQFLQIGPNPLEIPVRLWADVAHPLKAQLSQMIARSILNVDKVVGGVTIAQNATTVLA